MLSRSWLCCVPLNCSIHPLEGIALHGSMQLSVWAAHCVFLYLCYMSWLSLEVFDTIHRFATSVGTGLFFAIASFVRRRNAKATKEASGSYCVWLHELVHDGSGWSVYVPGIRHEEARACPACTEPLCILIWPTFQCRNMVQCRRSFRSPQVFRPAWQSFSARKWDLGREMQNRRGRQSPRESYRETTKLKKEARN